MRRRVSDLGLRVPGRRTTLVTIRSAAAVAVAMWSASAGCSGRRAPMSPGTPDAAASAPARTAMDRNADCCMCHLAFLNEPLSLRHAKHDIACDDCHGPSRAHSTDEKFQTPPDVVVKPNDVAPFCLRCHTPHKPQKPPRDALAVTNPQLLGKEAPNRCTSCHGRHRIARATTKP